MMRQYRKRPVVVDAFRLGDASNVRGVPPWAAEHPSVTFHLDGADIVTLEGVMHANPGDWIIRGVKGELYPCRADIFEATYEAVN